MAPLYEDSRGPDCWVNSNYWVLNAENWVPGAGCWLLKNLHACIFIFQNHAFLSSTSGMPKIEATNDGWFLGVLEHYQINQTFLCQCMAASFPYKCWLLEQRVSGISNSLHTALQTAGNKKNQIDKNAKMPMYNHV